MASFDGCPEVFHALVELHDKVIGHYLNIKHYQ
ncbi:IS1 family transposase [Escherichia coli]|nr:IS1 family transposase [Escherichia coli]